jgi:hypothetical protein
MLNVVNVVASTWSDTLVVVNQNNNNNNSKDASSNNKLLCLYGEHATMVTLPDYPGNDVSTSLSLPAIQYGKLLSNGQYLQLDSTDHLTIITICNGNDNNNAKDTKYLGQYQAVAVSDEERLVVIKGK